MRLIDFMFTSPWHFFTVVFCFTMVIQTIKNIVKFIIKGE